jgi:hypothetical protein
MATLGSRTALRMFEVVAELLEKGEDSLGLVA